MPTLTFLKITRKKTNSQPDPMRSGTRTSRAPLASLPTAPLPTPAPTPSPTAGRVNARQRAHGPLMRLFSANTFPTRKKSKGAAVFAVGAAIRRSCTPKKRWGFGGQSHCLLRCLRSITTQFNCDALGRRSNSKPSTATRFPADCVQPGGGAAGREARVPPAFCFGPGKMKTTMCFFSQSAQGSQAALWGNALHVPGSALQRQLGETPETVARW